MNRFFNISPEQVLQGFSGVIIDGQCADISDDGQHLACIERNNVVVRVYDLAKARSKFSLTTKREISSVSIATATRRVLTCSSELTIWDLDTGLVVGQFSDHDYPIHSFTLSRDHSRVLTSSGIDTQSTRVYDIVNVKFLAAFTPDELCISAFHTDNNSIVLWKPNVTGIVKFRLLSSGSREPEITERTEEVDWGTIKMIMNDPTSYRDDGDKESALNCMTVPKLKVRESGSYTEAPITKERRLKTFFREDISCHTLKAEQNLQ